MSLGWFPPLLFNKRICVCGEMWLYRTAELKYQGRQNKLFILAYSWFPVINFCLPEKEGQASCRSALPCQRGNQLKTAIKH